MTDLSTVGVKAPAIPSKWDIIPIHTSDRAVFKTCRRRWSWSSPSQLNLVPKASIYGVTMPLWFGTGVHHALERYYNPVLKEDPVAAFIEWFELQWDGGIVDGSMLKEYVDRSPIKHPTIEGAYIVKGLNEILPDPDEENFQAHKELGIGMMEFYKVYAEREDNFAVMMVEHDFSIPLIGPDGTPLTWVDKRPVPSGYTEQDFIKTKEVHARGRQDIVVQDLDTGQFGIFDHKTAAKIDDDYFRDLPLNEQFTTYAWAAEREAEIHDLEYKKIDFVVVNALRKNYPKPPTMTSKGLPSYDRQKEGTTAELFEKCIKDNNLDIIFKASAPLQAYYAYLVEMGDKLFIQRDVVRRSPMQKANCGSRMYYEAIDMLNNPVPYHNPTKNYDCLNCQFRPPCLAVEAGYDFESMLQDGYESNYDR